MRKIFFLASLCALVSLVAVSCTEDESSLGLDLQDPSTLYDGKADTAYGVAYTIFDDSLLTSGYSSCLVGCYSDALFGNSEAIIYTQVSSSNGEGVEFDQYCLIDSVVLSLSITELYGSTSGSKGYRDLHFEVYQLAEGLMKDSAYYADDELAINGVCLFNDIVKMVETDTMVADIKLNNNIIALLNNQSYATADDFEAAMKGIRIRLVNDGNPLMATVNMAASATKMTVYYTYNNGNDSIYRSYDFAVGSGVTHFNRYINSYNGVLSVFNSNRNDSIDGARYLYLSPMGGTNIKVSFDASVRQFKQQHPYAVIHYAELLLPVADIASDKKPSLIAALKYYNDGTTVSIPDLFDDYTSHGYDGTYNEETGCFRIRITQHFQKIMNSGFDLGTLLVINGRRSSAAHTVVNGYNASVTGGNPLRVVFVYSE